MNDVQLTDDERRALARARVDVPAAPELEPRILRALRSAGLTRARRPGWRSALGAAAVILAFAAGAWTERAGVGTAVDHSPRFVLLLYGGTDGGAERHGEYARWAQSLSKRGVHIDGEELSPEELLVSPSNASAAPAPAPRGYFVVSVPSIQDAGQIAASCPHLQHGGHIVIRRVVAGP